MSRMIFFLIATVGFICMIGSAKADAESSNCAANVSEVGKLTSGVNALKKATHLKSLNLYSQFVATSGDHFRVVYDNDGNLGVISSKGNFSATVCTTPRGIRANLGLDFAEKLMTGGKSSVQVNIVGVAPNTIQIASDLNGSVPTNFSVQ